MGGILGSNDHLNVINLVGQNNLMTMSAYLKKYILAVEYDMKMAWTRAKAELNSPCL